MEVEKGEAQAIDLKAAEARSTCEECGEYGHVQKNCPEEAKMLDYMKKGEWIPQPNFRYGQGRPQFNASSSIQNSVPLRIIEGVHRGARKDQQGHRHQVQGYGKDLGEH